MKLKIKFILLLFVCFFALNLNVKADYSDNTSSGGGGGNATSGCGGKDSCWHTGYYGLRMTLYEFENSGNNFENTPSKQIGQKVDFIGNQRSSALKSTKQLNRIEILAGTNPSFSSSASRVTKTASWLSNMYKDATKGRVPSDVKKHVLGDCNGKNKGDYTTELEYLNAIEACMIPFFQEMGAENELHQFFTNVKNGTNTKDIFIMYEPMADISIKVTDSYYFGTGTEIAYLISQYSLSWVSSLTGGGTGGNFVSATAYQASGKIAGYNPINLATTRLPGADHNNKSKRYGVSVGVARLSEIANIDEPEPEPEEPDICQFDLVTKIVKDCKDGTEGYVMDIDDWDCIYASRNHPNANINQHFYTGTENRYCSIFCRERVYYYYPGSGLTVKSGHHFSVGQTGASNTLLPVNMTGRSECRINYGTGGGEIGKINYTLFKTDWETANKNVLSTWNTMNVQLAYSDSIKNATKSSYANCAYFCDNNDHGVECCVTAKRDWDDCKYGSTCANTCKGGYVNGKYDSCATGGTCVNTCRGGWGPYYCIQADTPYNHGYWYTPTTQYYNGSPYTASGWCSHCGHSTYAPTTCSSSTSLSTAVSNYNTALKNRNQYLTQLMQCNNFQRTYKDFKPTIQFKYDEGEYEKLNFNYSYSDDLDKELEIRAQTNYYKGIPDGGNQTGVHKWNTSTYENATSDITYVNGVLSNDMLVNNSSISDYYASGGSRSYRTLTPYKDSSKNNSSYTFGDKTTIAGYDCVTYRSACNSSITNTTYPTNDSLIMWTTKEFDYELKPGVYNYVRKDTGQSLLSRPDKNYYVVGYSNLPTHYSRKTRSDYHFYLDFSPEIFGVNQKFYKFLKLGANTGITYGQEEILSIYEKLWNNATLNNMIQNCTSTGEHLDHDFVSEMQKKGISPQEFLETPCAKQYNCTKSGSKIYCSGDIFCTSCNGNRNTSCCKQNYQQLRACIQSQVVDRVGKPLFTDTDYTYKCTYRIENEVVCPPDSSCNYIGISAIYRTIDLNDPFPDRTASGNWTEEDSNIYITSNRGVTANNIYTKKDPMYKITLTPSLASDIRQYNDSHDMLDYNLECNTAGERCKSNFIRKTYSSKFSGCGISGKGSSKCVAGEAW